MNAFLLGIIIGVTITSFAFTTIFVLPEYKCVNISSLLIPEQDISNKNKVVANLTILVKDMSQVAVKLEKAI